RRPPRAPAACLAWRERATTSSSPGSRRRSLPGFEPRFCPRAASGRRPSQAEQIPRFARNDRRDSGELAQAAEADRQVALGLLVRGPAPELAFAIGLYDREGVAASLRDRRREDAGYLAGSDRWGHRPGAPGREAAQGQISLRRRRRRDAAHEEAASEDREADRGQDHGACPGPRRKQLLDGVPDAEGGLGSPAQPFARRVEGLGLVERVEAQDAPVVEELELPAQRR